MGTETIADIVADIRAQNQGLSEDGYALSPYVHDLLRLADRIKAAYNREHEATCEKSSHVGNAAKLGEALNELLGVFDSGLVKYSDSCDHSDTAQIQYVIDKAEAALAAPPRNCDVGTVEEQAERFMKFCSDHQEPWHGCSNYCLMSEKCALTWAQMPYNQGGEK